MKIGIHKGPDGSVDVELEGEYDDLEILMPLVERLVAQINPSTVLIPYSQVTTDTIAPPPHTTTWPTVPEITWTTTTSETQESSKE